MNLTPFLPSAQTGQHPASWTASPVDDRSLPGAELSCGSDPLLGLFLRHLVPADLEQCSSVCRHWYSASCADSLQVDGFLNAWQPRQRQQLLQAAARHSDSPEPRAGALREWLPAEPAVSLRRRLYRLMQQRLKASAFSPRSLIVATEPPRKGPVYKLLCSPDSRFVALSFYPWHTRGQDRDGQFFCSVYALAPGHLQCEQHLAHEHRLHYWRFAADSLSLQAVDAAGQWHEWQRTCEGRWLARAPLPLGPQAADRVTASPDGDRLAVVDDGTDPHDLSRPIRQPVLYLLDRTASGDWTCSWQWRCPRSLLRTGCAGLADLCFSDDGQVCVFTAAPHVFVCPRRGDSWSLQFLDTACARKNSAVLAPDGKALALYDNSAVESCDHPPGAAIEVWQPDELRHWHRTGTWACDSGGQDSCAMAFSPDSQRLVFPDRAGRERGQLCLLEAAGHGLFQRAARLEFPPGAVVRGGTASAVTQLQFNATGARLLARTCGGLHIWRRAAGPQEWVAAGWLTAGGPGEGGRVPEGRFSPDSFHCALWDRHEGQCSIWGPDHSGQYRKKVSIKPGAGLHQVQFTGDGSQLLLAFCGEASGGRPRPSGLACLSLVPEPQETADVTTTTGGRP